LAIQLIAAREKARAETSAHCTVQNRLPGALAGHGKDASRAVGVEHNEVTAGNPVWFGSEACLSPKMAAALTGAMFLGAALAMNTLAPVQGPKALPPLALALACL
jgi:hypothetical protein